MKQISTILLIAFTVLFNGSAIAQNMACSVKISSTDSLVCYQDEPVLSAQTFGPDISLMASNTAGNNHRGNMFDIVATNAVTILSFDASPMGNTTIAIYYKAGTWNGFANTPSAWTYIGAAPVAYTGGFSAVAVPVNITIPAGQTYAFYVSTNTTAGVALNYSNGNNVGNVYSGDANITFLEGGGMEYPFTGGTGAVYQPRVWNGNIHYALVNEANTTYNWSTGETTQTIQPTLTSTSQYTIESTIPGCPTPLRDTLDVLVSLPVLTINTDFAVCSGTSVALYGEGVESYAWSGGVVDSVAFEITETMEYFVTGTDSAGCTVMDSVEVTVYELPVVSAGNDFGVCSGDSVVLTGTGAETYTWDNGVTDNVEFAPQAEDDYVVTGTDTNGCISTDTITVQVFALPVVSAGSNLDLCQGVEYTFQATGAQTYEWTNNALNGTPVIPVNGMYTVVGTDANGCSGSDEVNVILHNVMASIFASGTTLTAGTLVDMTAEWVNCADMSPIAGETDVFFQPVSMGSYAIVVQDNVYGCKDTSNCVSISFVGLDENTSSSLSAYPVPTNGKVTISSSNENISRIELMDVLGKILEVTEPNNMETEIDLSSYSPNQFFVRVYRGTTLEVVKVVRQ